MAVFVSYKANTSDDEITGNMIFPNMSVESIDDYHKLLDRVTYEFDKILEKESGVLIKHKRVGNVIITNFINLKDSDSSNNMINEH